MTILETIASDLDKASKTTPTYLLRRCISKRLSECDKRFNDELDFQIRDLMSKFDKLSVYDMGKFIKRLSRSINRSYVEYTNQLIAYRDAIKNSKIK